MQSTSLYTSVARVAQALAMQSPETLIAGVSVGATTIILNQAPPSDWQVGCQLLIDGNNLTNQETVTVSNINGTSVTISALTKAHLTGAPVINSTILSNYVSSASRWFDSLTYTPAGFAYEEVTETKEVNVNKDNYVVCALSKPIVSLSDITSMTFQNNPYLNSDSLDLTKAWVIDNYILKVASPILYASRDGVATINYSGGYKTLPDDLVLAVTMLAARQYKMRDSGYGDAVGNSDLGMTLYHKPIPSDIAAIVQRYRRWTV